MIKGAYKERPLFHALAPFSVLEQTLLALGLFLLGVGALSLDNMFYLTYSLAHYLLNSRYNKLASSSHNLTLSSPASQYLNKSWYALNYLPLKKIPLFKKYYSLLLLTVLGLHCGVGLPPGL